MEPAVGIEPTTGGLRNRCSTSELRWRVIAGVACHDARMTLSTSVRATPDESGLLLSQAIDSRRVICYKHWCLSRTTAELCRSSSIGVPRLEGQPRVC
jgi:hypothetical protein